MPQVTTKLGSIKSTSVVIPAEEIKILATSFARKNAGVAADATLLMEQVTIGADGSVTANLVELVPDSPTLPVIPPIPEPGLGVPPAA